MIRIIPAALFTLLLASVASAADPVARDIKFTGAENATLRGTLLLPAGEGKFPALLLIAGSGPTDRDGNQPPAIVTDLLKQIAQALAEKGIATLRYDKRGMGANIAEWPRDKAAQTDFVKWENFAADAVAGVDFLRAQKEIDPDRAGILGHSEGGALAMVAAGTLKTAGRAPAAVILMSTPGRPMDQVLADQIRTIVTAQGGSPDKAQSFVDENARITKTIRDTGQIPDDVPPGLQALYPAYLKKFLASVLKLDPANLASELDGPVLLLNGEADVQVSPERDAKPLAAALAARKKGTHTVALIPKASHNLKIPVAKDDPGFTGLVANEALEKLQSWAAENLAKK